MAKITAESREAFAVKMQPYKDSIDKIFEKEKNLLLRKLMNNKFVSKQDLVI